VVEGGVRRRIKFGRIYPAGRRGRQYGWTISQMLAPICAKCGGACPDGGLFRNVKPVSASVS
jgi:hypothetical protein